MALWLAPCRLESCLSSILNARCCCCRRRRCCCCVVVVIIIVFVVVVVVIVVVVVADVVAAVFAREDKCHCHATIEPSCFGLKILLLNGWWFFHTSTEIGPSIRKRSLLSIHSSLFTKTSINESDTFSTNEIEREHSDSK
jgi:hypothetical protein